jgi:PilZ domain
MTSEDNQHGRSDLHHGNGRPMEHRWGQRFMLDTPASVTDGAGWTVFARVRDISASGAFLQCPAPLPTVTRVLVRFKGPRVNIVLYGNVIRRTATGIGIEWSEFAPAAVAPLLQREARPADVGQHQHRGASPQRALARRGSHVPPRS